MSGRDCRERITISQTKLEVCVLFGNGAVEKPQQRHTFSHSYDAGSIGCHDRLAGIRQLLPYLHHLAADMASAPGTKITVSSDRLIKLSFEWYP